MSLCIVLSFIKTVDITCSLTIFAPLPPSHWFPSFFYLPSSLSHIKMVLSIKSRLQNKRKICNISLTTSVLTFLTQSQLTFTKNLKKKKISRVLRSDPHPCLLELEAPIHTSEQIGAAIPAMQSL